MISMFHKKSWRWICTSLVTLGIVCLASVASVGAAPNKIIRTLNLYDRLTVNSDNCALHIQTQKDGRIVIRCVNTPAPLAPETTDAKAKLTLVANDKLIVRANACRLQVMNATPNKVAIQCEIPLRTPIRISRAPDGSPGNGGSYSPAISTDGRFIAFESGASNLVSDDTNDNCTVGNTVVNCPDIFVYDAQKHKIVRVSVASDGTESNGWSQSPSISGDGQRVAFASAANNLVSDDTSTSCPSADNCTDIFVHDSMTGQTTRVSVASDGTQANDASLNPVISANGRYVAFTSYANNLVADDTNGEPDVFVHDIQTGETTRVSVASDGTQSNGPSGERAASISANGRFIALDSRADNLVSDDTNDCGGWSCADIFVHDLQTGETTRVSIATNGTQGNGWSGGQSLAADGLAIAFASDSNNLVADDTNDETDIFLRDLVANTTTRVSVVSDGSQMEARSSAPHLSADGRHVSFQSIPKGALANPPSEAFEIDLYVHDMQTGETEQLFGSSEDASAPVLSGDGRFATFGADDRIDVPDTNDARDIFIYQRW